MSWFCCSSNRKHHPEKSRNNSQPVSEGEASKQREKLVNSVKVLNIPAESLQIEKPLRGIDNLGNSCYIGAAIQCLSNTRELTEYMLSGKWEKEANAVNPIGTDGQLLVQYVQLLHKLWEQPGKKVVVPKHFKETLDKITNSVRLI